MLRLLLTIILACSAQLAFAQGANPASVASAPVVGKVALVEGDARFLDKARLPRVPRPGDPIYEGESIVTGPDGEVHLAIEDGGYIGVRPDTELSILDFKAESGPDDRFVINLLKGSFRTVTGWIARLGGNRAVIRTPTAAIGVRGTEHEPMVIPEGVREAEAGTYDRVYAGETVIETPQGAVSVQPNQTGFAPQRGAAPPRVLERTPQFFRPTRNEARFQGLHERIRQQLDTPREERRQLDEQRRGPRGERGDELRGRERSERPESAERPERPERAERPERPERAERPERPERAERPERVERPERAERSGRD